MKVKLIFLVFWFLLLLFPFYALLQNVKLELVFGKPALIVGFVQRLSGLMIFTLLPLQLTIGAFMSKISEKLGSWIFWFHITQAILIYSLILVHPLSHLILRKMGGGPLDPFYVFTDFCLICSPKMELYLSFGRFAFVFFTVGYFAGKFRTLSFLRKHWRLFHYFNYLGFLVVSYHAFKVGSDFASMPYVFFFWFSLFWVGGIIVWKIFNALRETTS